MSWIAEIAKSGLAIITISSRLEKQEKRMDEIENNYLSRFEGVTKHITDSKESILEHQHEMELRIMNKMR